MVVVCLRSRKPCGGCRRVLDATPANFYRHANRVDGLSDRCKPCQLALSRSYRARRRANGGKRLPKLVIGGPKRCPDCDDVKPWTTDNFYVEKRDQDGKIVKLTARCKSCTREHVRRLRDIDAEGAKAKAREAHRRRMQDPAYAARQREYQARYHEKIKSDPRRHAETLETRRLRDRMRREMRGETLRPASGARLVRGSVMGRLPATPLVAAVDEWLDGRADHVAETFIDTRNLSAWRKGEYATTPFDVADRVLIGIDLLWWEVWKEGNDGHERAAELFTGEKVAA